MKDTRFNRILATASALVLMAVMAPGSKAKAQAQAQAQTQSQPAKQKPSPYKNSCPVPKHKKVAKPAPSSQAPTQDYEVPGPDDDDESQVACNEQQQQQAYGYNQGYYQPQQQQQGYPPQQGTPAYFHPTYIPGPVGAESMADQVIDMLESGVVGEWVSECVPQGVLGPSMLFPPAAMYRQQATYQFFIDDRGRHQFKFVVEEFADSHCSAAVKTPANRRGTWRIRRPVPDYDNVGEIEMVMDYCDDAFCPPQTSPFQIYTDKVRMVLLQPNYINFGDQLNTGDFHWYISVHRPGVTTSAR